MHILLTNDDGIDAPGLAALRACLAPLSAQGIRYSVVAPDQNRSECGHSVTTQRALKVRQTEANAWSVDGTPVDCVRLALSDLVPEVDMVLSGVNDGGNLGVDLLVSGTFAAAKEGFLRGLPAVALSHYRHPSRPRTWEHVPRWLRALLVEAIDRASTDKFLLNINLPAADPQGMPECVECDVDHSPFDVRYESLESNAFLLRSSYQDRPRKTGSDVEHCFGGKITVTRKFT